MKRNSKIKTPHRDNQLALVLEQLIRDKRTEMPDPKEFNNSVFMKDLKKALLTALGNNQEAMTTMGYLMLSQ